MAKIINVVYKVDDKALLKAKTEIQGIEKETKDSEKEMLKLDAAIKKAGNQGSQSFLNFKNILSTISVVGIVAGLAQLGRKILELGIKQEMLNVAFTTFLGSAEKAKVLLADLSKFAIVTPFTPDQVNNAAKALLAFGVQGKDIIPTLKLLGDVSAGTGKDLTEMAVIFGQIRSTGRLMGQDLLQLINAGFNPLQIISQKTGKSVAVLKQEMEKGLITFDMVEQAFKDATSAGGLFFNLMEKQSQTVGGQLSTIEGNLEEIGKRLFENNQGPVKDLVKGFADLTSNTDAWTEAINAMVQSTGLFWLAKLASTSKEAADETKRLREEQLRLDLLNAKSDLEAGLGNRVFLIQRIIDLSRELGELPTGTTEDPLPWATSTKSSDIYKTAQATKELTKSQKEAREEFFKMMGFTSAVDKIKAKEEDIAKEEKIENDANERSRKNQEFHDNLRKQKLQQAKDEEYRILEEAAEREKRLQQAVQDFAINSIQQILYASLLSNSEDFSAQQEKFDRELELAGDNERAKDQIRQRQEVEEKAFRKRQKEEEQKNALKRIAIDTAINVIRSITNNGGIPLGLPFGALAAAAGVIQATTVRKLKKGEVLIDGPGTSTSDSIPAMLSKNESVINAKASMASPNLLQAINDRKIDDRILSNIAAKGGSQAVGIDYERLGQEFRKGKVDYDTHGYTIMKGIQKGKNFKMFIRSKVQGY